MRIFAALFILFSCVNIGLTQRVDSIPTSARPVYALEVNSPFFGIADTFYVDSTELVLLEGSYWMPVYEKQFNTDDGVINLGYPRLICYVRSQEERVIYKKLGTFPREGVMYDYSLEEADSTWILTWWNQGVDSIKYVVDSVKYKDCVIGDSIKHLYVTAIEKFRDRYVWSHRTVWIEGVGDIYHPFLPSTCLNGTCEYQYSDLKIFHNNEWIDINDLMCEDLVSSTWRYLPPPQVNLYPNPVGAGGVFYLESSGAQLTEVYITELASGRELYREQFAPTMRWELKPNILKPGLYLVRVRATNGGEAVRKVVVR